jgi:hypothetical protein
LKRLAQLHTVVFYEKFPDENMPLFAQKKMAIATTILDLPEFKELLNNRVGRGLTNRTCLEAVVLLHSC